MKKKKVIFLSALLGAILMFAGSAYAAPLIDNHDGTVTDTATGLMWQQKDDDTLRNWDPGTYPRLVCQS